MSPSIGPTITLTPRRSNQRRASAKSMATASGRGWASNSPSMPTGQPAASRSDGEMRATTRATGPPFSMATRTRRAPRKRSLRRHAWTAVRDGAPDRGRSRYTAAGRSRKASRPSAS
ncbi:MAG: hypothetical protein ACYTG3_16880 [Planctomycetota bacterium]